MIHLYRGYRATVIRSRVTVEGRNYTTYGIEVESEEGYASVLDISPDRREVEALCRRIREGRLSPLHLQDVAEDYVDRESCCGWAGPE